jgi:translation elongation factor P/translation initiation factor 5A
MWAYTAIIDKDFSNIISILKVKPPKGDNKNRLNTYYLFTSNNKKYMEISPEELQIFLNNIGREQIQIVARPDKYLLECLNVLELPDAVPCSQEILKD